MVYSFSMLLSHKASSLLPLFTETELRRGASLFRKHLTFSLAKSGSSLPCILNPIARDVPHAGFGVAISIGGTNGYVSAFHIDAHGTVKFFNRGFFVLPHNTTKEKLFHLITKNVLAITRGKTTHFPIGIGFAYPLKPVLHHGFVDGVLLSVSKGRRIDGLVGKRVGEEYHRFLIREYGIDTSVTVANDAICLLLGGKEADVAGVVGTGLNFAYWERKTKISPSRLTDFSGFDQKEIAINIESAEFDGLPLSPLGKRVDKKLGGTDGAHAEKESAGAYLYQIFNAGKDEIIGTHFPKLVTTDQINDIRTGAFSYPKGITDEQQKLVKEFASRLFHRSAQIVAIELCGILLKLGKTRGVVPIVMEGGIFWKAKNYSSLVNQYVNVILPDVIPSFARLYGSSRRGIAFLAMNPRQETRQ